MPEEPPIERTPQESSVPEFPDAAQRSRVGVDTWVAEHGERLHRYEGWRGWLLRLLDRIPLWARVLLFAGAAALYPIAFRGDEYLQRVGVDTLVYMMLAIGLNIVVGYAGLLDLGYIAFFGVGAYTYAIVSSDKFDYHWPSWFSLPFIMLLCAAVGLLLGLPSRRLIGDYLAITRSGSTCRSATSRRT
jgi:ABC-type branched-subunit amino acid transport system permease subunit